MNFSLSAKNKDKGWQGQGIYCWGVGSCTRECRRKERSHKCKVLNVKAVENTNSNVKLYYRPRPYPLIELVFKSAWYFVTSGQNNVQMRQHKKQSSFFLRFFQIWWGRKVIFYEWPRFTFCRCCLNFLSFFSVMQIVIIQCTMWVPRLWSTNVPHFKEISPKIISRQEMADCTRFFTFFVWGRGISPPDYATDWKIIYTVLSYVSPTPSFFRIWWINYPMTSAKISWLL